MTQEQINALAKEYAEEQVHKLQEKNLVSNEQKMCDCYADVCKEVIDHILRDHLIVEESRVIQAWQDAISDNLSTDFMVSQNGYAMKNAIESLFPNTFNPTEL